ncbi:hypothetical protein LZ30DRAFT_703533, partial [Colletotrichum cereale]
MSKCSVAKLCIRSHKANLVRRILILTCVFFADAMTGGTDLISCSNVTGIGTSYCCDHAANCCNSGIGRFDILPAEPQVWATWNRESTRFVVVLHTSDSSTSTTALPLTTSSDITSISN